MSNEAGAGGAYQYLVVGPGPGELCEAWAGDPMQAVRMAYESAGGGGAIFDVVTAGPAKPGAIAVYAGNGQPVLLGRAAPPCGVVEQARRILIEMAVPVLRVQTVSEAPMVAAAVQPAAFDRALGSMAAFPTVRRRRLEALGVKLRAILSPLPGGVFLDLDSGDPDGPLVRVHARGVALFRLMRITAALREAAAEEVADPLRASASATR